MVPHLMVLLFTVVFAAQLGLGLISPLLPIYAMDLGATGLWLGIIFSVFSFARFVAMPIVGRYSDTHGRRMFIIIGLAAYTLLSLMYIFASSSLDLTLIRFAHGIASALIIPVAMAYVGDLSPKGEEGRYMGMFHMALFLGIGFGPLLGGVFADEFGINSAFIAMFAVAFINLVFVVVGLPESRAVMKDGKLVPYRIVLTNRVVQALLTYRTVNMVGQGMLFTFLPIYAVEFLGLPLSFAGLLISTKMIMFSLLQYPGGILADRFNRVYLVIAGGSVFIIVLFAMPLATDAIQLLVLNVVGAVGSAISVASTTAITTSVGREVGMGTLMGLYNSFASLGMGGGPIVAGIIFDYIGMNEIFYAGGLLIILSVAVFYVLMPRQHHKSKS